MTYSQIIGCLFFSIFDVWLPLISISWFIALLDKGGEPLETFLLEMGGLTLIKQWPDYKVGQKKFLLALSIGFVTVGVSSAWVGVMAAEWAIGKSPGMSQPFGSWATFGLTQLGAIIVFYSWLEIRNVHK